MELKEATERLLEIRDRHSKNVKMLEESKVYVKNTAFEDVLIERRKDIEVIDTVLKELDRLQIENEEKDNCKLIEPDHFTGVGKMAEKIEELDVLGIGESQNIDNLELANSMSDLRNVIREIQHKLNEVIRRINNERL